MSFLNVLSNFSRFINKPVSLLLTLIKPFSPSWILFRRYNLIEATGDLTSSATKIVILPTILMAVKSEDITEVYNTIIKLSAEEVK